MLDITKLLSEEVISHSIRYSKECSSTTTGARKGMGPVVAWNITQKCNYNCKHCYSNADNCESSCSLSFDEIKRIVDELRELNVPVILLSGGEPLIRDDIFDIIEYITEKGIRVSLSTNGSLIDAQTACQLKRLGISYVGISIDGSKETNDSFRGVEGAYDNTIRAIENCHAVNQKVGLRFTLQKHNYKEVPRIIALMEETGVKRICFYHLVPSGRGLGIKDYMLAGKQTREVIDYLYEYSKKEVSNGESKKEILTVTNHTDGPYIYLKMLRENPVKAEKMLDMLAMNGGNRSGMAIVNIDWEGNVYPDQFTRFIKLGNVRETSFIDIWNKPNPVLEQLRKREQYLQGRCSRCRWLKICNGNLRARAFNINGDLWAPDPACYLEEDEI